MKILIATKNPAKFREMEKYLLNSFEIVGLNDFANPPDIVESGLTFQQNAIFKARAFFEWSGIPTIADDGGLEIDYLGGEPGVYSRRWPGYEASDQELIDLALSKLKGVPLNKRTARLRTVGAFCDGVHTLTESAGIEGYITETQEKECEPGYPFRAIFRVSQFDKLYQDLTVEEHEEANHRKVVYGALAKRILQLTQPA